MQQKTEENHTKALKAQGEGGGRFAPAPLDIFGFQFLVGFFVDFFVDLLLIFWSIFLPIFGAFLVGPKAFLRGGPGGRQPLR